jgi:hypothetical protein
MRGLYVSSITFILFTTNCIIKQPHSSLFSTPKAMSLELTALKPSALVSNINLFLSNINIPGWRVHLRIVEFNNDADRQKRITLLSSQLEKAGVDELVIQSQIEELCTADILSNGIKSLRQSGSILMLGGDWERDLQ